MGNGHMHYSTMLRCLLMIALFIYFLFAGAIPHILKFRIPCFDAGLYLITLAQVAGGVMEIFLLLFYWVPVAASCLDLFWHQNCLFCYRCCPPPEKMGAVFKNGKLVTGLETWALMRRGLVCGARWKREEEVSFVAKECLNLNLLQGSGPRSFRGPKSNEHGPPAQVDCALSCRCWVKRAVVTEQPVFSFFSIVPEHITESD